MKRATTIEEQIEILQKRNVIFKDKDKAREILLDIGFYRIGFYSYPFEKTFPQLENRNHELKSGTTFKSIVDLYYFDYDLRRILVDAINRIEVNIRTYITYTVSNKYRNLPIWFVNKDIMKYQYINSFEDKVYKIIKDNPIIKRHHSKYKHDKFAPAWKTLEFMTFGGICTLFLNIKDLELRKQIAEHYHCGIGVFINYIETIRIIRNTCAHGGCVYNISTPKGIKSGPAGNLTDDDRHNIKGIILVICYILGQISHHRLNDFKSNIALLLNDKNRENDTKKIISKCTNLFEKDFVI